MNASCLEPASSHPGARPRKRAPGAWLALLAAVFAGSTPAAPRTVEAFDTGTWPALQASLKAPAVVVFTTTDCAHCPAVFDKLARAIAGGQLKASLVGVVMDRAPGEDDAGLKADKHYRQTARLFAFDGQAPALRHGVDPKWRGVTPYVAYLAPGRPPKTLVGPPSEADIGAWSKP